MKNLLIKVSLVLATFLTVATAEAQDEMKIPINVLSATAEAGKPMILYITGDGGWNSFSSALGANMAAQNCPVVALNAKSFFWKKKTAQQAGLAAATLIKNYSSSWNKNKILLVGYSFGADVLPFIYQNLPQSMKDQVQGLVLLSPSGTTDFEIHLTYIFSEAAPNAALALNNISSKKITILTGSDENEFPFDKINNKNFTHTILPGGHHYDGNEKLVSEYILKTLN